MSIQKTIADTVRWDGIGLHTGQKTSVMILPAELGFGIKFRRTDIEGSSWIMADPRFVSSTHRCTSLKSGEQEVKTVEHLLAAVYLLELTNLRIEVTGPELPILDGTIGIFYKAIKQIGVVEQEGMKDLFTLSTAVHFTCPSSGAEYMAFPSDRLDISVQLTLDSMIVGDVSANFKSNQDVYSELGIARTFVEAKEVIELSDKGLIKGGDLSNAMVLGTQFVEQALFKESLIRLRRDNVDEILAQVSSNTQFRYPNEPARHKLADLIGDLALLGAHIRARIVAIAPGHTGNVGFVKMLKEEYARQLKGVPFYDPNAEPLIDTVGLLAMLPHRYPFLLVDKIIELSDNHVVGVKNITMNEALFQGHFPGNPVFPGVLQMEALAQTGGILALSQVNIPSDWDTYFLKMDQVKFKRKVSPGDTLLMKMELMSPIRRGIVQMKGTSYVGDVIVSEGELTAQIVDRTKGK